MPNVTMPNGDIVAFPDDMPREQIRGLIAKKFPEVAKQPENLNKYNELESGVAGAAQGMTGNFGDEIMAGITSPVMYAGGRIASAAGYDNPLARKSLAEIYSEERQKSDAENKRALKDNPKSYIGGSLLGTVGTGLAGASTKAGAALTNSLGSGPLWARAGKAGVAGAASGAAYAAGGADEGSRGTAAFEALPSSFAIGAAAPVAFSAIGAGVRKGGGALDRIRAMLGSEKAASKITDNIIAKRLADEGFTAEQVARALDDARASGLRPTLGEATGSSSVLQAEKSVLRGTGKGANIMRDALYQRNRDAIPNALSGFANKVKDKAGDVSEKYQAASDEAAGLFYKANEAISDPAKRASMRLLDAKPLNDISKSVDRIKTSIDERLGQLGDVSNIESRALKQAQNIIANAEKRGSTFDSLLDAKKQLDDLFIEGADAVSQKNASRYVASYTKEINRTLNQLSPTKYKEATKAAKAKMAADDLTEAVNSTNEGSIGQLYNKFWAKPEVREDFLRKLPDDETREAAKKLFGQLERVRRGFGGSDTAFNLPANRQLANEAGLGFDPYSLNLLESLPRMADKVGQRVQPLVYQELAKQSINPDAARVLAALARRQKQLGYLYEPTGGLLSGNIAGMLTQ